MKLISWNVNGIRSVLRKGFWDWFTNSNADVVCLQESKITAKDFDDLIHEFQWQSLDAPLSLDLGTSNNKQPIYVSLEAAKRPGYSGTLTFSKHKPLRVLHGIGASQFDDEGRTLTFEFEDFFIVNTYVPNVGRELDRTDFKLNYNKALLNFLEDLRQQKKPLLVCGDFNVAHTEMDLKNPKTNKNNAGFTQPERDSFSDFLSHGYIDVWREAHPDKNDGFTWWSYRPGVRERNIGWRIDYFIVTEETKSVVKKADIHPQVMGSDHCPVSVELDFN